MEACGSAHHWARVFQAHAVRLLPARDVRPYVRRNKTDRADAAGLIDADRCDRICEVAIKTPEQQGVQAQHRIREALKSQRTALSNLLRGVLREYGIVIPKGAANVTPAMRDALEDAGNGPPMALRESMNALLQQREAMARIERSLAAFARRDAASRRH